MKTPTIGMMTDHQANAVACAALRNLLASIDPLMQPETSSICAMLDGAIADGSENAATLALGLILAGAGAWEATLASDRQPSYLRTYETVRAETGGGSIQ